MSSHHRQGENRSTVTTASAGMKPRVMGFDGDRRERWDAFVGAHPRGTVYHLSAWAEILRRSYRFLPQYLVLEGSGGELTGILPLVYRSGPISGPRLNSLPLVRWAGPLAGTTEEEAALIEAACELVRGGRPRRLHVRARVDGYQRLLPELSVESEFPVWELVLPDSLDGMREQLKGKRGSDVRRNVRKAESAGVVVREARDRSDLRRFYRLYLKTMRRHSDPPRTLRQFEVLRELLGPSGAFKMLLAEHDGEVVGGEAMLLFRDRVELLYNVSDERRRELRPNYALYWQVMRVAIEHGLDRVSMGAAPPGGSLAAFKRHWGAEPVPRYRYSYPAHSSPRESPDGVPRALRRRESLISRAWGRAPLPVTRAGGALLYRYL
jgi:hypothetical protein